MTLQDFYHVSGMLPNGEKPLIAYNGVVFEVIDDNYQEKL